MKKEIIELGEKILETKLEELETLDVGDERYGYTESTIYNLFDKLNATEKLRIENLDKTSQKENDAKRNEIEENDKSERRRIEEERNKEQFEIEREKQKIGWKRVVFEMGKIVAPVLISGVIFKVVHDENMEFEEHGTFHSSSGRSLNGGLLNRFLKF